MSCKKGWLSQIKHNFFKDAYSASVLALSIFLIYTLYQHMSVPSLAKLNIDDVYEIAGRVEWRKVSSGKGSHGHLTFKLDSSHEVFSLRDYSGFAYGKARAQIVKGICLNITRYPVGVTTRTRIPPENI